MLIPFLQTDKDEVKNLPSLIDEHTYNESSRDGKKCRFYYFGNLVNFFSSDNNIATIDIVGNGDYDLTMCKQYHYMAVVRKSGQYNDRLFIDYHNIMDEDDNDWKMTRFTAFRRRDNTGTVPLFFCAPSENNYNAFQIKITFDKGKKITFDYVGLFMGALTDIDKTYPDFFLKYITNTTVGDNIDNGFAIVRKQLNTAFIKQRSAVILIGKNIGKGILITTFKYTDLFKTDFPFGHDSSKILIQVTPFLNDRNPDSIDIAVGTTSSSKFTLNAYRIDSLGESWGANLKAYVTITQLL